MLQYFHTETGERINNLIFYTNGMLLTKENVEKLNMLPYKSVDFEISIDGIDRQEYELYRKGAVYDTVKKNVRFAIDNLDKDKFHILITNSYVIHQYDMVSEYVPEKLEVPAFLKEDFPNVKIRSKPTMIFPDLNGEFPINNSFNIKYLRHAYSTSCVNLFTNIAVDCEGNFQQCSCGLAGTENYGNIMNGLDLLFEFQHNKALNAARRMIADMQEPDLCKYCWMSPKGCCFPIRTKDRVNFSFNN